MSLRINTAQPVYSYASRIPKSPNVIARQRAYRAAHPEMFVRDRSAMNQSGQNEECEGKGCFGRLKNRLSKITASVGKATGMYGGRTRRKTRRTRRTRRKTRHTRR